MNINPIFRDSRGNEIKAKRKGPMTQMQRYAAMLLIIVFGPLIVMGAVTQISLTTQVSGILPSGNGGTGTASTLTGVVRGGTAYTAAELSGDATTSGSNAVTVVKINGTTLGTNAAADQTVVTTASAVAAWTSITNCPSGALQYATSTHTFACGTVLTGTFADNEIPSGTINGSTTAFTLAHTPSPAASLTCFNNGVEQRAGGAGFTLATATMTYGVAPPTGTTIVCNYRF